MAVPVVASSASFHDVSNEVTRTIAKPSGTVSGDWLLLTVSVDGATNVNTPTGFTLVRMYEEPGGSCRLYIFKRKADGTEGATFTITSANEYCTGNILRITGAESSDLIDVISASRGELGKSVTPYIRYPVAYAVHDDSLILRLGVSDGGSVSISTPASHTLINYETGGTSGTAQMIARVDKATAGFVDSAFSTSSSTTEEYIGLTIIIRSTTTEAAYPNYPFIRCIETVMPPTGSVITHHKPYGTVEDDLLLMMQVSDANTFNVAAGFTNVRTGNSSGAIYISVDYKVAGASEGDTYSAMSSSNSPISSLARVVNADSTSPINASSINSGSGAAPAGSTITPSVDNCNLFYICGADDDDNTWDTNYPTGWDGVYSTATQESADLTQIIARLAQTSATSTGTVTGALDASEEWIVVLVAIAPASSPDIQVDVGLSDKGKVAYAPSISAGKSIAVPLADKSKQVFSIVASSGKVVIVPLVDKGKVAYAPTVSGGISVSVGIVDKSKVVYEPTIAAGKSVAVDLVDKGKVVYEPAISAGKSVTVGLVDKGKVVYAPDLTMNVFVGLVDKGKVAYAPTITLGASIAVPLADKTKVVFTPTLSLGVLVEVPLTDKGKEVFTPVVGAGKSIVVPLVDKGKVAYVPTILFGSSVEVPLVDKSKVVYDITVVSGKSVTVPLVNKEKVVYGITVGTSGNIDVPLADKGVQVFTVVVFANDIVVPLVDKSKVAYAPSISIEGDPNAAIGLHARPMIVHPGVLLGHG